MGHIWEDALTFLGSSSDKPTTREQVRGDEKPWVNTDVRIHTATTGWQGVEGDGTGLNYDSWVAWYFTSTNASGTVEHGSYVVGTNIIYPNLDGAGAKFAAFTASTKVLEHFYTGETKANDRFDRDAFVHAADALTGLTYFLDGWITEIEENWAKSVASEDSDWQGSAAGAFRAVLLAFRNELDADNRMIRLAGVDSYLRHCDSLTNPVVTKALETLWAGWQKWWASSNAWPANAVSTAIAQGLKGATLKVQTVAKTPEWLKAPPATPDAVDEKKLFDDLKFTLENAPFGDPSTAEFWKQVDTRARAVWVQNLTETVDVAADAALNAITAAYQLASGAARPLKPFPLLMPTPKKDETDPTKDDKTDGSGTPKIDDPTVKTPDGGPDLTGAGGPDLKLDGNGSGSSGGGPNLANLGLGSGGSGTGSGTGSGNGAGLDLIGNPGAGGDPLLGGGGSSKPVTVPPGSVITKDGRVVDENGKPVLDSNGNPMVAGPNYTVGPDGTLRDDKGNTVSQYQQLLADRYSGGGGDDLLTPSNFGPGGFSYSTGLAGLSGSGSDALLGSGGGPMITGMGGGLSSRALAAGGDPNSVKTVVDQANAERMAAEKAARAAAQEQALLTGRQTTTSSGGMPPMMPPGGGMGGGPGGQGDKDRRRTTWLAEDEETWGTETAAVQGVIGR